MIRDLFTPSPSIFQRTSFFTLDFTCDGLYIIQSVKSSAVSLESDTKSTSFHTPKCQPNVSKIHECHKKTVILIVSHTKAREYFISIWDVETQSGVSDM